MVEEHISETLFFVTLFYTVYLNLKKLETVYDKLKNNFVFFRSFFTGFLTHFQSRKF